MQVSSNTAKRRAAKLAGLLPAVFAVAFSVQACNSDDVEDIRSATGATDPNCRPSTCSTLAKNCGLVNDGCGGTLRCGTCAGTDNDCRQNVCDRGCVSDTECPNGSACINGSCSEKCSSSADCNSGQNCSNGSCVANAATSCRYDADCRSDERCTNGYCAGTSTGNRMCRYDSECRSGESCRNGRCESFGGQSCRYHQDCRTDESCVNGLCTRNNGSQCRYDRDCRSGERCNYGVCTYMGGGFRAQCTTRGIRFDLGPFQIGFKQETWLEEANANDIRVDSCWCSNGNLRVDEGTTTRTIRCARCDGNQDTYTCYE
jgi:hypothetical protein